MPAGQLVVCLLQNFLVLFLDVALKILIGFSIRFFRIWGLDNCLYGNAVKELYEFTYAQELCKLISSRSICFETARLWIV